MPYKRPVPRPRRYTDTDGGLWIDGEFFMGRVRVPPMPPRIALSDRATGVIKVLAHTAGMASELANVDPRWSDVIYYGKNGGPYSGDWRLYLNNGNLAFEWAPGYSNGRILTRRNFETHVLEITADNNGNVVYTEVDL